MKEMKDEGDRGRRTKEGGEAEPSGEASGSFVHQPCPAVGLTLPATHTREAFGLVAKGNDPAGAPPARQSPHGSEACGVWRRSRHSKSFHACSLNKTLLDSISTRDIFQYLVIHFMHH